MNWIKLESEMDLRDLKSLSESKFCMIFKYSSRCGSSAVALDRLERSWNTEDMSDVQPFFLDLIANRDLSNMVSQEFNVMHESPQVLLIENSDSVFDTSHFSINYDNILSAVMNLGAKNEN
jgi:bacillithiol system protein YtxJ